MFRRSKRETRFRIRPSKTWIPVLLIQDIFLQPATDDPKFFISDKNSAFQRTFRLAISHDPCRRSLFIYFYILPKSTSKLSILFQQTKHILHSLPKLSAIKGLCQGSIPHEGRREEEKNTQEKYKIFFSYQSFLSNKVETIFFFFKQTKKTK